MDANVSSTLLTSLLLLLSGNPPSSSGVEHRDSKSLPMSDVNLMEFPLNLEYLEAEFFLWGALGHGLDAIAPNLSMGGPPPIGVQRAKLDSFVRDIIVQFAYQEVGHLRAIKNAVQGFPRPLMDLSASTFGQIMERALGRRLEPRFDPYANDLNFLIASYLIPYVGLTGYVGANPALKSAQAKRLVAGLLGVESAQDAVIRTLLYERRSKKVEPYNVTVAEFTDRISALRNKLGGSGIKDEGIVVPLAEGAKASSRGNVIPGNRYSVSYRRRPKEILRIVYGTARADKPGGFYPKGADGRIAKSYLR